MSTSAVGQAAPAVAADTSLESCGMKVSKALTIVGGILATSTALVEGSRIFDLSANFAPIADLFQHLPSMQTNIAIGVAGVSAMIAGQVLGHVVERRQNARAEEAARLEAAQKAQEAARLEAAQKAHRAGVKVGLEKAILGIEGVTDRIQQVRNHPQAIADVESKNKPKDDPYSIIENELRLRALPSRFTVKIVSEADSKLYSLLYQAKEFLISIKDRDDLMNKLSLDTVIELILTVDGVDCLIDHRLWCLDMRAKFLAVKGSTLIDFEPTFEKIMSQLDSKDSAWVSLSKISHQFLLGATSSSHPKEEAVSEGVVSSSQNVVNQQGSIDNNNNVPNG
ncbi:MAG: hypothetical protein JSS30_02635 [Verrucomicrobia bacterium]|nr:hypothetical protein [Verrucomicrobiota bacterium]